MGNRVSYTINTDEEFVIDVSLVLSKWYHKKDKTIFSINELTEKGRANQVTNSTEPILQLDKSNFDKNISFAEKINLTIPITSFYMWKSHLPDHIALSKVQNMSNKTSFSNRFYNQHIHTFPASSFSFSPSNYCILSFENL